MRALRQCCLACVLVAVPCLCAGQDSRGRRGADAAAVRPFTIHVPDAVLADLRARLDRARLPDALNGDGWTYGTDLRYLKELVAYWREGFDWRAQERRLNRLEQFTTTIDGLTIHFVHRRSKQPHALPLLVTHGWPGSFVEFVKVLDPLTDPVSHGGRPDDGFDVVIPSIPGFAFSDKPREPGYAPARIAAVEAQLMARLGYRRYGVQGGDWGAIIGRQVALSDAPHVAGLHLNMCTGAPPAGGDPSAGLSEEELARLKMRDRFQAEETGYQQIQGTKPQTLGVALNDSPVGLAAWIVEKFRTWCDCDGNPETVFTKDELLTNITLYWVTGTAASSARIYYESRHAAAAPARRVEVPTACADFPKEVIWSPRRWLDPQYNITRWTRMPRGGHFAAFEQPALFVDDVRAFFRDLRSQAVATPVISPILHASVQIALGEQVIQIDPWGRGDLAHARAADLVLITDDPAHHLDPTAIRRLRKPGAPVLLPPSAQAKFPEGTAIANGESKTIAGIGVEAIPAYDIKPGEPSHPKGKANGYLVSLGGQRIYIAGVTECVPEIRALRDVDVAFVPMNLPLERMTPSAAADCVNAIKPRVVYVYHYDQNYAAGNGHGPNIEASLRAFRAALAGGIEFRDAAWYPR